MSKLSDRFNAQKLHNTWGLLHKFDRKGVDIGVASTLVKKKLRCGSTLVIEYLRSEEEYGCDTINVHAINYDYPLFNITSDVIATWDTPDGRNKKVAITWLRQIGNAFLKAADRLEKMGTNRCQKSGGTVSTIK